MSFSLALVAIILYLDEVVGSTEYGSCHGLCCHVQHQADVGVEVLRRQEDNRASVRKCMQGRGKAWHVEEASCLGGV